MFIVSDRLRQAPRSMEADYTYPSVPHRPVTLELRRQPSDSVALVMDGPKVLPWKRPVGPDREVPFEDRLRPGSITPGQEGLDAAYGKLVTTLESQVVARHAMDPKEAALSVGRARAPTYSEQPLARPGGRNVLHGGLVELRRIATLVRELS